MNKLDASRTVTGRTHPETSIQAASRALGRSGNGRRRVLKALVSCAHTDEELQHLLQMSANSQRPRRIELVELGFVAATEERRPTTTGMSSIVWAITEHGRWVLAQPQEPS